LRPLFDAVTQFLLDRERPTLILLEDLHAADEPSLLLLRFLGGASWTRPRWPLVSTLSREATRSSSARWYAASRQIGSQVGRAPMHLRMGSVLEELARGDLDRRLSEIAHHLALAAPLGDAEKAVVEPARRSGLEQEHMIDSTKLRKDATRRVEATSQCRGGAGRRESKNALK
jgi:hypothetical protein